MTGFKSKREAALTHQGEEHMTKDEALKLGIEALENIQNWLPTIGQRGLRDYEADALTAMKEALAQPAQKTATGIQYAQGIPFFIPPAAQPAQQPQVRTGNCLLCGVCASEGHKIQAKRPWVGLTEEEIKECFKITPDLYLTWHIYEKIEAKLKEKNT